MAEDLNNIFAEFIEHYYANSYEQSRPLRNTTAKSQGVVGNGGGGKS